MSESKSSMTEREIFYKDIIDAYQGNILVLGKDGKMLFANHRSCATVGIPVEEFLNSNIYELEKNGVILNSSTKQCLETKKQAVTYITGKMKYPLLSVANPVFDDEGNLKMAVSYSLYDSFAEILFRMLEQVKQHTENLEQYFFKTMQKVEIIAESAKSIAILQYAERIAKSDGTVIIYGESGVGKEVYSRYIHESSRRKGKAFIPINCASIPENLLEAELFGYEAGAFTGASTKGKAGVFELAHGGTLFLDEIGELPFSAQAKLLRVLETGEVQRVGGVKPTHVDVRIVAATNRDLLDMAAKNSFREDLYYRLNVLSIKIPPVRERPEDIMPLANTFLSSFNRTYGTQKVFSAQAVEKFLSYSWPGNVREIRNIVERMVIASADRQAILDISELSALPGVPAQYSAPPGVSAQYSAPLKNETVEVRPLREVMAEVEREYILRVFKASNENAAKTAQELGIDRTGLYKKLKRYGVKRFVRY